MKKAPREQDEGRARGFDAASASAVLGGVACGVARTGVAAGGRLPDAENRVLRERLGDKTLRLTVAERRRLAMLGEQLGRKALAKVATIARPETILRWYRELAASDADQGGPRSVVRSWSWC